MKHDNKNKNNGKDDAVPVSIEMLIVKKRMFINNKMMLNNNDEEVDENTMMITGHNAT